MINVNGCAKLSSLDISFPGIDTGIELFFNDAMNNGYIGSIQFENKEELKQLIDILNEYLEEWSNHEASH